MNSPRQRIYLDNAATSFPKPESVYAAVDHYQRDLGGAVGRSATRIGSEIQRTVDQCRHRMATLLGVSKANNVIFTLNGTDSLNLALHGLLRAGDRVIATLWEHNSVLRPLSSLAESQQLQTSFVRADEQGTLDLDHLRELLKVKTRLVCITHASNVTGIVQPVAEAAALAHQAGALVLVDAAQTVGHLPVSMTDLGADLLACPGHKGLLGPLGTGILAIRAGLEDELQSIRQGGTGTTSESESQPDTLPEKFESGNHNAPGIFGLAAATKWLQDHGIAKIQSHEEQLTQQLIEGLRDLPHVRVVLGDSESQRVGLVSIVMDRIEPQTLSSLLDEHFSIETRAGLHCSPRAHQTLGTINSGGTVRFSFGPLNTTEDVDATLEAMAQIAVSI